MKPQAKRILAVLSDGNPHRMTEFLDGRWGFTCLAPSQRVGELRREGHDIRNISKDGGVATYQLQP
jgi:nitric oxide reductase activation protein